MKISLKNADLRSIFSRRSPYGRASVIVPFIAIAIALGVLAYRSYHLSVRMEKALNSFAVHYIVYAAEVTARRTDVATSNARAAAHEQWQLVERNDPSPPDFDSLQQWLDRHPWVVAAIYVPDEDPTNSIYVSELDGEKRDPADRKTHDFFTAGGSVRYTYDARRLLEHASAAVIKRSLLQGEGFPEAADLRQHSAIRLVKVGKDRGVRQTGDGYAVAAPLAAPLSDFGIEAAVNMGYASRGWRNQRVIGAGFAGVAIVLVAIGAMFAVHGIRKESEATALRAALIANVSHELRTPLSMIRLGAETLKRSAKLKPHERADLEDSILREVVHLSHLVENVLDVARLQKSANPFAFTQVNPEELVRSVVGTYASWISSKGFELQLDIAPGIGEQMWDRETVSRALLNLIDNAMKYSSDDRRLRVFLQDQPDAIVLGVEDHGIGIPPRDLQRIFEPYYRASFSDTQTRRGAGLGLTLVHQIVKSHGGRIEVESEPGEGSVFRLLFPKRSSSKAGQASALLKPNEPSKVQEAWR